MTNYGDYVLWYTEGGATSAQIQILHSLHSRKVLRRIVYKVDAPGGKDAATLRAKKFIDKLITK